MQATEDCDGGTNAAVHGKDRGEGSGRGGGDYSAGGRARFLWDAGPRAGAGVDQRLSLSFVAVAVRGAPYDAGQQVTPRGCGRAARRHGGRGDGAGRRGTHGGSAAAVEEGAGKK